MQKKKKMFGFGKVIINNKPITRIGLDSGVLVALIDNNQEYNLKRPEFFIKKGICYIYQLVVNQAIGVLIYKRKYPKEKAIQETLKFLDENNILLLREEKIDTDKRNKILNDLKSQRNKLKVIPKPEDSDLDIISSYKCEGIDCIITTNYKHFIELGNYLGIRIERIETEKQRDRRESDKIMREFFWRPKKNFKKFK